MDCALADNRDCTPVARRSCSSSTSKPYRRSLHSGFVFISQSRLRVHVAVRVPAVTDWTGRPVKQGKRSSVSKTAPPILKRLKLSPELWLPVVEQFVKRRLANRVTPATRFNAVATSTILKSRVARHARGELHKSAEHEISLLCCAVFTCWDGPHCSATAPGEIRPGRRSRQFGIRSALLWNSKRRNGDPISLRH